MTGRSQISLRSRLLAVVAGLGLALLAVAILAGLAASSLSEALDDRLDTIYPATAALARVRPAVIDQENGERGFVITGNTTFLDPYNEGRADAADGIATMRTLAPSLPGLGDEIDKLVADLETWRARAAGPEMAATQRGDAAKGLALIESGSGKQLFQAVRDDLDALQGVIDRSSEANRVRAHADQQTLRNVLVFGLTMVVGAIVVLAFLLTRWVTGPTDRLVRSVGTVAAGEFRQPVEGRGPPEFAEIGAAVDAMRRRILAELDELERYNEALEQTGPVVQLLRLELEPGEVVVPPGVEVAGKVLAAEGLLAGDFYDVVEVPGGRFAVVVADVSGHGHRAGVLAIRFKFLLESALELGFGPAPSLSWAAERLGDTGDMFVTCALVVVDHAAGQIAYASAGHSPGLLLPSSTGEAVVLDSTGPMIGPFPGTWTTVTHAFAGDAPTVVLCSDGLLEARAADELFGFERLVEIVRDAPSVHDIVERSCAAARDHAGERLRDDLTVVAVRLTGNGAS